MKKIIILLFLVFTLSVNKIVYGAESFDNRIFYGNLELTYQLENDIGRNVFLLSFNIPSEEATVFYVNNIIANYNNFITASEDYQLLYVVDSVNNNAFISNLNGIEYSDNYLYLGNYDIIILEYERIFTIKNGDIVFDMSLIDINNYFNNSSWSMYVEGLTINQSAYNDGYNDGRNDGYNDGLNENRDYFGINYNGYWLTAEQWGDIRYDDGYNIGLSNEVDWWSWATTFFLMPFKILNIQILPGIRIGYFALFSLLLGVVGWFFFLVGKGGGRRK